MSNSRPSVAARKSMRPPMSRPSTARALAPGATTTTGRISPAESIASIASSATVRPSSPPPQQSLSNGIKRKERDFDQEGGEETNINVVVRCRGRNDREVRENSGVVVSTNGVKGNNVELSMGPSALSNKSYNFDKVFSPAADQTMIYEEVVVPILDEVSNIQRIAIGSHLTNSGPGRIQLYDFCIRPNRYWQDLYNVW